MRVFEKLLTITSWFFFVCSFIVAGSLFVNQYTSHDVVCAALTAELSSLCVTYYLKALHLIKITSGINFELFGFAFKNLREIAILLVVTGVAAALFARIMARLLRRRRIRLQGFFVDMPGFRPIKGDLADDL